MDNQQSPIEIKQETIKNFPSPFQQAKNLTSQVITSGIGVARGAPLLTSDENAATRLGICKTCEFFNIEKNRCTKCGCFMLAKTKFQLAKCPVGKW